MEAPAPSELSSSPPPPCAARLRILSAICGPAKIDVTAPLQAWVAGEGRSCFLFLPSLQLRVAAVGSRAGDRSHLTIRYSLDGCEATEEHFEAHREVLIGDMTEYYRVISDGHARIPKEAADDLLHRFRPILILHPEEASFPARVDWYLPKSSLWLRPVSGDPVRILDRVTDPEKELNRHYQHNGKSYHTRECRRFLLRHNDGPDMRTGERGSLADVPYYGTAYKASDGAIVLVYYFFYAYNGSLLQSAILPASVVNLAGVHEGDWEHVCVVMHPETQELRGVYMSRHGDEARWYLQKGTAGRDDGWHLDPGTGRVVVWCAKESHANYNTFGQQGRGYCGYFDDRCGKGDTWDPKCVVNVGSPASPGVPWLLYGGHWGKLRDTSIDRDGPTGPIMKRSFARPPPMTSLNTIPKQANERLT